MALPLLQYGSKGKDVEKLQGLLNAWSKAEYGTLATTLKTDGDFGSKTRDLTKDFQVSVFLYKDGKVGSKTWAALQKIEKYNCFDLPKPFVAAPNQYQCWAGATAMLLKRSAPVTTRPAGVDFETLPGGGVGGLGNSHANMRKYATAHGLQMLQGETMSCLQLVNLIDQFGRLMLNIKGVSSSMTSSSPNDSHLLNLVGARGTGEAGGTTITLYNPSAVGFSGRVITQSYQSLKAQYPKLTYQVFYKTSNSSSRVY